MLISYSFDALVKDLFPTANMSEIEYKELNEAIKAVYDEMKLVYLPHQVRKILEFYEQCRQRMGVVLVGPSGSGKTTLWKYVIH